MIVLVGVFLVVVLGVVVVGAIGWFGLAAIGFVLLVAGVGVLLYRDRLAGRAQLGRRRSDPRRRVEPREWARPRDLQCRSSAPAGRWWIGELEGQEIRARVPNTNIAGVAGSQRGKTKCYVTPWTVEHDGPVIVTSVKRDVVHWTAEERAQRGRVWVFDPTRTDSAGWRVLVGCEDWVVADRQARYLANGNPSKVERMDGFDKRGARLLSPLLYAAALSTGRMGTVLEWLAKFDVDTPARIIRAGGDHDALLRLEEVFGREVDSRQRSNVVASAHALVAAYDDPTIKTIDRDDFDVERFLDGPNTLYCVSGLDHQDHLAPVFSALLGSVFRVAEDRSDATGRPLDPYLRVILDEVANVAPLQDLPKRLSLSLGQGVQIATLWQSLAQLDDRYGRDNAQTILDNSAAKLFLAPIDAATTIRYLESALGTQRSLSDPDRHEPKVTPPELQQMRLGRALFLQSGDLPALVSHSPHPLTR